jgi:RHS repeat-associated protein
VEFLELGVSYGETTEWKLYGPDLNGRYGGLNGTGGLDGVSPYLNTFAPIISDFRGNVLAVVTNGVVSWNPARPTGYGAVPGYRPQPLANDASVEVSSAWRGHWVDLTGYYQIGLRPYDPVAGKWLTYDSVWNEGDPNGYSYCGGDPINGFDSDGRIDNQIYQTADHLANMYENYTDQGGAAYMGSIYDQSSAFRAAVAGFFGSPQNAYGQYSSDYSDLSFTERLGIIDLVAGGDPQTEYNPDIPTRSAGASIAAAVLNTDSRQEAWDELSNPNFNSGLGVATWADAGVSYVANTVDAAANMIPIVGTGKALLEDSGKAGIKAVAKMFEKDAAETTAARTASGDFYSVAFQTKLSPTSYPGVSRYMHFKEANTALDAAMGADADLAATMDRLGVSVPRSSSGSIIGKSPENWVWHHDAEAGVMQLVPKAQHPNIPGGIFWDTMHPGGVGGFSIWGQ